jgi:hypothetical protein
MSRNSKCEDGEFLLNGTSKAGPVQWHAGQKYRLRFIDINANNTVRIALTQNGVPVSWTLLAKDGAELPAGQALTGPASLVIAPEETYDFQFRTEQAGQLELSLEIVLLKEKVTQSIQIEPGDWH